jgi:hypothetical protein
MAMGRVSEMGDGAMKRKMLEKWKDGKLNTYCIHLSNYPLKLNSIFF